MSKTAEAANTATTVKTRKPRAAKADQLAKKGPIMVTRALVAIQRVGNLARFAPTTGQTNDIVSALQEALDLALAQLKTPPVANATGAKFTFSA